MLFNPLMSIFVFASRCIQGKISSSKAYIGKSIELHGGCFEIFRHVQIRSSSVNSHSPVVLILQFDFPASNLDKDVRDSFFQIPLFAGLPGFQAKLWTFDKTQHLFQGVYQWQSAAHAHAYLNSFAVRFIKKRARPDSVTHTVLPGTTVKQLINRHIHHNCSNIHTCMIETKSKKP